MRFGWLVAASLMRDLKKPAAWLVGALLFVGGVDGASHVTGVAELVGYAVLMGTLYPQLYRFLDQKIGLPARATHKEKIVSRMLAASLMIVTGFLISRSLTVQEWSLLGWSSGFLIHKTHDGNLDLYASLRSDLWRDLVFANVLCSVSTFFITGIIEFFMVHMIDKGKNYCQSVYQGLSAHQQLGLLYKSHRKIPRPVGLGTKPGSRGAP